MERKNGGLEDDPPFQTADFQVQNVNVPGCTPPKFNIAPEKWCLEDEFPFGFAYFLGSKC